MCVARGKFWKGGIVIAENEELEQMDASELHARRLNAKEVSVNATERWKFHIPCHRWNGKTLWRRSKSETIHHNPGQSWQRRGTRYSSRWIRRVFFNPRTRLIMVWWWSQKWFLVFLRRFHLPSSCGTPSQTVRADWRIIPYSTEIHWRYHNHRHDVRCDVGETYCRILERWWISRIVRYVDRFHEISWYGMSSHSAWCESQKQKRGARWRPDNVWQKSSLCGINGCLLQRNTKRMSKDGLSRNVKAKIDRLRGTYFIDPWNHCTSTVHRSETMGQLQERQSGLRWSAKVICEVSKTSWQMGKHLVKGGSVSKSLARHIPRICIVRGRHVERRHIGCRNWGVGEYGRVKNSSSKKKRKRCVDATKVKTFYIPGGRWYSKIVRRRPWSPRTHFFAGPTCQEWRSQRRPSGKFWEVSTNGRNDGWRPNPVAGRRWNS